MIELQSWTAEFVLPSPVWLSGLFNPQSFLTAIMQTTARKQELPLDKMCLVSDVTSMLCREEVANPPKEGVYINGLFMEVILYRNCPYIHIATTVTSHPGSTLGHRSGLSPGFKTEGTSSPIASYPHQSCDPGDLCKFYSLQL